MRRRGLTSTIGVVAAVAAAISAAPGATAVESEVVCRFSDDRFTEISGMTYSQRHDGVLYLHNDSSGGPSIYAVDGSTCATLATLRIDGIEARDLEAIGSGRDAKGRPILWLADIGDNRDSWPDVRLHRVREPARLSDATLDSVTFRFTYPDRPHNAEALLSDPDSGRVWVVTKQAARGRIYALPERPRRDRVNIARPVGRAGAFVTDGSVSPDGSRFVLRDYVDAEIRDGLPPGGTPQRVYLPIQFQGEAVTWTPDGRDLLVASERDDRLIRVPLAGTSAALSSASGQLAVPIGAESARQVTTREEDEAVDEARAEREETAWTYIFLGAVFVVGAVVLFVVTEVRRRRAGDEPSE